MILRGSVFSNTLEMETGLTVLTPNNFKMNKRYQVTYLLHGLCGNSGDWTNFSMLPLYANDFNIIFIMPEGYRSFYADMKYGLKYFTYISEELPEICKCVFNISPKREDTAIMGVSMGGYGALKCALSKPTQYGFCGAFSSPCLFLKEYLDNQRAHGKTKTFREIYGEQLVNDFQSVFGEQLAWRQEDEILELAGRASKNTLKPKIYSACGTEDFLREYNQRFCNEMKKLDLDFTYEEWEGGHDWYFFDKALRKAALIMHSSSAQ